MELVITERRLAEGVLQISRRTLAEIIDFLPDATFVIDLDGRVVTWNRAIEKMTGVRKVDMIGQGNKAYSIPFYGVRREMLLDRLTLDDEVITKRHDNVSRKGSTLFAEAFCSALNDGKGAHIWATATSLYDDQGKRMGAIESIRDITDRKKMDFQNKERMKELRAFYSLAEFADKKDLTLEELYQNMADALPSSWQFSEIACARIVVGEREFHTGNFRETSWMLSTPVEVRGSEVGRIEVGYLEERPTSDEGPFLKEERMLIDAIAERIGHITERKRIEEALQASEEMYRLLVQSASEAIVVAQDGMLRLVNPITVAITGFTEQELLSIPFPLLIHPEDRKMVLDRYQRRSRGEDVQNRYSFRLLSKDGTVKWVEISAVAIDWKGRRATLNFLTDVTERQRAEAALKESVLRYELVMDGSSAGLWDSDVVNKRIHFSPHWKAMRGFTDDEIGESAEEWTSRIHPDDAPRIIAAMDAHLAGKTDIYEAEYRVRRKDGTYIWVLDRGKAVRDATGRVIRNVGSEIDITERKQAEEALRESEHRLARLADQSSTIIWELDTKGLYTYVGPTCEAVLGYRPDELVGKKFFYDLVPAADRDWVKAEVFKVMGNKERFLGLENPMLAKDGHEVLVSTNGIPILNGNGTLRGYQGSDMDITERKRTEMALRQANNKLGILNSITRHDINNQMMVLNGFLDLCRHREKDPDLAHHLEKMSQAAANVQEQIAFTKDYQDLGIKAPAGASVGRRIEEAFMMLHPPGVTLEDRTEGIEVLTDPLADKVPYNLVDNSMRHGGHVTRIRMSAEPAGDGMLVVYEDDGVGISAEDRKHLFEKGFGTNTGYGLFLIREILAITGIIIVENGEAGKGARFEMRVPPGAWRRAAH
ncbi:MAG: PAS domain S-box protein [Methanomassiliicoccales archaeon]|nr:PAS domain S-box protein [Methanomassiliicoccales archaeon]